MVSTGSAQDDPSLSTLQHTVLDDAWWNSSVSTAEVGLFAGRFLRNAAGFLDILLGTGCCVPQQLRQPGYAAGELLQGGGRVEQGGQEEGAARQKRPCTAAMAPAQKGVLCTPKHCILLLEELVAGLSVDSVQEKHQSQAALVQDLTARLEVAERDLAAAQRKFAALDVVCVQAVALSQHGEKEEAELRGDGQPSDAVVRTLLAYLVGAL